jgi:lysophospholipase L1-like esterase
MKRVFIFLLSAIILMAMAPVKKTHILFFGDSITQAAVEPGGYITLMQHWLDSAKRTSDYQLTGAGISGNKVYDLYLRLEDDVLAKKPDIVFVYIGVNDVWHKASMGTGTDIDKFEKFYVALIKKMQSQNIRVILCTPATIGERYDNTNQQDGDMNAYSNVIRKLSADMNCQLVDLRKAFMDYEMKNNTANAERGILTSDRVHLNPEGSKLVAAEMMKALGWK